MLGSMVGREGRMGREGSAALYVPGSAGWDDALTALLTGGQAAAS